MNTEQASHALEDHQTWAIVALDGSGRYATSWDRTFAQTLLAEHAARHPGVTFVIQRWNGPDWRAHGHTVEYSERTFGKARA